MFTFVHGVQSMVIGFLADEFSDWLWATPTSHWKSFFFFFF